MAATVHITDPSSAKSIALDDRRRDLVLVELQRVGRFSAPLPKGSPPVAADLVIDVEKAGRTHTYLVVSETVLIDTDRQRVHQFYMGLQLLQWMQAS